MDDSSIFDSGDGSDGGFSPVPKPKPAAKKAAAPKKTTAPKKTAAEKTTKAPAKKRPPPPTDTEQDSDRSVNSDGTPPKKTKKAPAPKKAKPTEKPRKLDGDEMDLDGGASSDFSEEAAKKAPKGEKSAADTYQKLTQLEHILKRPDTYVGSVEPTEKLMWVFDSNTNSMVWKTITMVPGLYKIFDEILVNAADNKIRDPNMDTLKVTVDREANTVSIYNNGRGIPIEIHPKEGIYIPEMIFGHLLTSSNYDDDQKKVTGGRNGYGAKLCNIFSTEFTLETADKNTKKKYKQTWTDNMSKIGKAKITSLSKAEEYTKITFKPDLAKFQMKEMDEDLEGIIKRRVYDLAGCVKNVKVYLNGQRINIRNFKSYCEMYVNAINEENGSEEKATIIHEIINDRWEIAFAPSSGSFQQVSFVNSIATTSGGTHVNAVADQISAKLMDYIKKKNKSGAAVKNAQIRNHFFLFVNSLIENPAFTSQTKEQLTTKASTFGSKCPVSDEVIKKIAKTEVIQNILDFANLKADKAMKKTDGSRRSRINNPKLIDANRAGTKDGHECVLILTEGESAKTLAVAGISAINGRDKYGVFPLRGKLLNVRDASHDQIMKNAEIQNIKQILGLQHKKNYESRKELRYGHLMIMTDQDHDGSHIKGLLINFFETQFPSLLRIPHFLIEFVTPIVRVFKGPFRKPKKELSFFTMPEYEYWRDNNTEKGWEHKYYKGLGTSTEQDAKIYFADLEKHMKEFHVMEDDGRKLIELAFSKKKADERKEWLRLYKPGTFLDHSIDMISYPEFVNKELILFSMADNVRSIPSIVDGLKPGQRKILFACFKRNLKKEIKVAQLAGYVSEHTAYQHGEVSLQTTIVSMAQTFVGTNNLNLLEPEGSFGTRLDGGKDAASPRYIYTLLSPFARKIFPAVDDPLLTYNMDDDARIEPEWFVPVVPLILINGADGIGTGWSSCIPNYNPEDIVENLRRMMRNEPLEPMQPWYRDWTGQIERLSDDRFKFTGIVNQIDDTRCEITELPIKVWTQDFKEKLEEIIKAEKVPSFIKDYVDYNSPRKVHFIITMESEKHMADALREGLDNKFKLSKTVATTNLVAFDPEGRITKYESVNDIMKEFYFVRLKYYQERKEYVLADLNQQLLKLSNQARFIKMIIDKTLIVSGKKRADIVADLKAKSFDTFSKQKEAQEAGENEEAAEDSSDDEAEASESKKPKKESGEVGGGYNYLLGMAIWSLTREKVDRLLKDQAAKEAEVDELIKKTPKDLWETDLTAFIEEWRIQLAEDKARQDTVVKKKKGGRIVKSRSKKKLDSDDDDDEEVWAPKAAKRKPAAPKVKAESKKQTTLAFKAADAPSEKAEPKKLGGRAATKKPLIVEELSDSELEMIGNTAKLSTAKPKATEKLSATNSSRPSSRAKSEALSSVSDKDMEDFVSADEDPKPTKAPPKKPIKDESDEFEMLETEKSKPKRAPAKKATAPTKAKALTKETAKPAKKPIDEPSIFDIDDSADEIPPKHTPSKSKRAAAKKPSMIDLSNDSDSDDGLGDMSKLVKGFGDDSVAPSLLTTSNNTNAATVKATETKKAAAAAKPVFDLGSDLDSDGPMNKPAEKAAVTAKPAAKKSTYSSYDSDSDVLLSKPAAKTAPPKKAGVPKTTAATKKAAAPKKPTATKKAPAKPVAKPARGKKVVESSDENNEDINVDQLLDDMSGLEDDVPKADSATSKAKAPEPAKGRPGRSIAKAKVSYKLDIDSEEEEEDESEDYDDESD